MNKSLWQYWILHALLIILSVYFYIFTEWLFFVTKPSFMSVLEFKDTFLILVISPLPLVLAGLTAFFVCWVFSRFLNNVTYQSACIALSRIIPALILSVSIFLLIDNFTYTVFRFGVISTKGLWGLSYLLLFLIILSYVYYWLFRKEKSAASSSLSRKKIISVISLPAISLIGFIAVHNYTVFDYGHKGIVPEHQSMQNIGPGDLDGSNKKNSIESFVKRPNILLIATDGLDAERMSVYGYERNTTPYIKEFTEGTSLFCENAFSNATISAPSIVSMLTGKLPTDTKLYYPPDILRGDDAYQHLPAILRSYGYRNIDFGIRYYADAYDLNMLNSFNESNFRKPDKLEWTSLPSSVFNNDTRYFINLLMERLETRFLLMTCQKEIINPYDVVTGKEVISYSNEFVLKRFLNFIDESNAPFFAHIHLMGTHGPKFHIQNPVFSKGQEQTGFMMDDFFDDAVLEFDRFFEAMVQELESRGEISNTIFVIHTDHSMRFEVVTRLPLIFIFPDETYAGIISSNVQNLDIPETLLDYMGIPSPHWMKGQSLISGELPRLRPVFITSHLQPKLNDKGLLSANKAYYKPPYYNLGKIIMVICDKVYELDLKSNTLKVNIIRSHTAPCTKIEVPGEEEVIRIINAHLEKSGYKMLENTKIAIK